MTTENSRADALTERDYDLHEHEQGLYRKFDVCRDDGSSEPGGKHHDCEYFILDMTHDRLARAALRAYADACVSTHPELSADLIARYALAPIEQPAAAPADLQGLRRSILTSREIVRDQNGMLSHPAVPYLDEDVNYETFFAAFGIEATFIHMKDDVDCDTYDRYFASNSPDCCTWTPSSPQGDGWMLLEIYDTEDGPVALYVREKKPESMRERWKREKRESDAAAPSPADERTASWYCCDPVQICSAQCDSCAKQARAALKAIVDERAECIAWANANGFTKYHESMCAAWEERARRAAQQLSTEIGELKAKLVSYEREREDQIRYLAAQSEEIADLKQQLAHADARVGLTAEARATIMDACQSISRRADETKESNTSADGTWCDADEKAFYYAELSLLERLVSLLATTQQPRAEVTGGDELKARRLIRYGECRCILTQYCDGMCNPIYEDAARSGASS